METNTTSTTIRPARDREPDGAAMRGPAAELVDLAAQLVADGSPTIHAVLEAWAAGPPDDVLAFLVGVRDRLHLSAAAGRIIAGRIPPPWSAGERPASPSSAHTGAGRRLR